MTSQGGMEVRSRPEPRVREPGRRLLRLLGVLPQEEARIRTMKRRALGVRRVRGCLSGRMLSIQFRICREVKANNESFNVILHLGNGLIEY